MSCDWAARLDARGYHTTSIKRPDTAGSWSGPTTVAEDGWKDGVSLIVHEAKEEATRALPQLELKVGDAAYLTGVRKGQPAEIVQIVNIFQSPEEEDMWLAVKFFWRPERLQLPEDVEWQEKELFLQSDRDEEEQWVGTCELQSVSVTLLHDPAELVDAPHNFFYRRTIDIKNGELADAPRAASDGDGGNGDGEATGDAAAGGAAAGVAAEPMEQEGTAADPATKRRAPRRDAHGPRIAALEQQVAELSVKAALADALVAQFADMKAAMEQLERKVAHIDVLEARVLRLETE